MSETDDERVLYRLQACPFCERVARALDEHGVGYESRFVEPLHSERDAVKRVSGSRTVPVLVDPETGATLTESANIVEYVETYYADSDSDGEGGGG